MRGVAGTSSLILGMEPFNNARADSRSMAIRHRVMRWYHGLFHLAQATLHDRWVKRLRLVAFLAATTIATQIVLRNALGYVGLANLVPSSGFPLLLASAVWIVAYPAMWLRMLTVMAEMEAKKEYPTILGEIGKLHHRHAITESP